LLIEAEEYGLSVAEEFVEDKDAAPASSGASFQGARGGFGDDATQNNFRPYSAEHRNVDTGTVDLSGAGFDEPGGTEMM
jgi:hypothetical protein